MAQFSQVDTERINRAVSDCNIWRYTIYETVAWIKEHLDIDVSYDAVRKYRYRQRASALQWIAKLAKSRRGDYIAQYRERIFEIEAIQQELWKLIKNPKTPPGAKIKAADTLLASTRTMVSLYDSMPVVKSLGDYINANCSNSNSNGQQQIPPPSTSSLNRDYDWGSYDRDNKNDPGLLGGGPGPPHQQPPNDDDGQGQGGEQGGQTDRKTGIRIPGRDLTDEDYR